MTAVTNYTCDNCTTNLNETRMPFMLSLSCQRIPQSAVKTSNLVYYKPAIEHDHHFCGLGCLQAWLAKRSAN